MQLYETSQWRAKLNIFSRKDDLASPFWQRARQCRTHIGKKEILRGEGEGEGLILVV